jgi:RHS repeat-associated protein
VPIVTQAYTYDAASRMATAAMGALSGSYAYHPNSSLVHTLTFKSGTTTVATTTKTFDALNRLTHIATVSANGTTAPVSHGYTLNALSQRTRVDLADGGYWIYGYNTKGEVVSGVRHSAGGTPVPGQSFGYNFDNIGNRKFATVDSGSTSYIANKLNQYTAITGTSGTIAPQHDADGNLTSDGTWTYAWDGENRLVAATSGSTSLSFAYDAQSRRIAKVTSSGTIRFIYDDWNLVAEIDSTNSPIRKHLWGLDLSGSPQGAGGVGGLIATSLSSGGSHFMAFDGNGNVSAAIHATDGTHSARFEYDPFGGTLSATGGSASLLPFRFSTKYQDVETGLYYYGFRYYHPGAGRWISRDPIEEEGGIHIYSFLENAVTIHFDGHGLSHQRLDRDLLQALVSLTHWLVAQGRHAEAARAIRPAYVAMAAFGPGYGYPTAARYMQRWLSKIGGTETVIRVEMSKLLNLSSIRHFFRMHLKKQENIPYLEGFPAEVRRLFLGSTSTLSEPDLGRALGFVDFFFSGCLKRRASVWDLLGRFELEDTYDWQNPSGKTFDVLGVTIPDSFGTLVEDHGLAKPFLVRGAFPAHIQL